MIDERITPDRPGECEHAAPQDAGAADGARAALTAAAPLPILELLDQRAGPTYTCPGERHPISRAVHLSRLAAGYPRCRQCSHGTDQRMLRRREEPVSPSRSPTTVGHESSAGEGIRGRYLNDVTRVTAERLGEAIAAVVWDGRQRRGRSEDDDPIPGGAPSGGRPTLVVGRDARPAGPDLATGLVQGLRRYGCDVVVLGCVSRPAIDFAVHHLRVDGGVYVTGAGRPASWTGIDVVDAAGVPWSLPGGLTRVQELLVQRPPRPTRVGGQLRSYDLQSVLRADFKRQLHGIRPLRVGVLAACPLQRTSLAGWFEEIPDAVSLLPPLPDWSAELPREVRRQLRTWVQEQRLTWLASVDEDGRRVRLFDERARPIAPEAWLVRLAEQGVGVATSRQVVVSAQVSGLVRGRLRAHGIEVHAVAGGQEALVRTLLETQSWLAADGHGRVWFRDHFPLCDGLVTLAHLLRLASQSENGISGWAA